MNLTNYVASKNIEIEIFKIEHSLYWIRFWYLIYLMVMALAACMLNGCGIPTSRDYLSQFNDRQLTDIDYVRVERDKEEISKQLGVLGYAQRDWPISAYYINTLVEPHVVGQSECFVAERLCIIIVTRQWTDALAHELIHVLVKENTHDHTQIDLWARAGEAISLEYKMIQWEIVNHNLERDYP